MALEEKVANTQPLQAIFDSLFGKATTTKESNTAVTGPLQQAFAQASTPMDQQLYDNLIASIFQKAAVQVPTLTAALANATGSRTTGNSPLALALNEQNNQAARDSAAAILAHQLEQQKIAASAAANLANVTRSSTQKQQTQSAVNPLLTTLIGFGLNKLDKSGFFKGTQSASPIATPTAYTPTISSFGGSPQTSFNAPAVLPTPSFGSGDTSLDSLLSSVGAPVGGEFLGQYLPDTSSLYSLGSDGLLAGAVGDSLYTGGANEFLGSGADIFSTPADFNPFTGGLTGGGTDLLPEDWLMFFANGGNTRPQRNRNYLGTSPTLYGQSAINLSQTAGGSGSMGSTVLQDLILKAAQENAMIKKTEDAARESPGTQDTGGRETVGSALNDMTGNPLGGKVGQALAMAALGLIAPQAVGSITGSLPAAQLTPMAIKGTTGLSTSPIALLAAVVQATKAQNDATTAIQNAEDPLGAFLTAVEAIQPGKVGNVSSVGSDNLAAGANAVSSITGIDPLDALMNATNAFGTGLGGGNDGAPSAGDIGDAGDFGGVGLFKNGGVTRTVGRIKGPGTGTSDSITATSTVPGKKPIRVSDGEYIIPADVVARPGVPAMLDALLAAYHRPV